MMEEVKKQRSFGGKISNFDNKQEAAFEKRHLRAYLKGWKRFRMGFNAVTGEPLWHPVKEVWS